MSGTTMTTNKVRFSYVHVFAPHANAEGQEPKYSVSILIDKKDTGTLQRLNAAIEAAKLAGKDKWGGKIPTNLKLPLHDGDVDRPDDPAYRGCYYCSCSSKRKPGVVDRNLNPILDSDEVYSGCYGRAALNLFAFSAAGNKGIGVGLNHLQKLEDGERLGGQGISVEAAFGDSDSLFD